MSALQPPADGSSVRAQLRAVLEDSSRGDVIVEVEGGSVGAALDALFHKQPASIEWLVQFHPEVVGINIELTLESAEARAIRTLRAEGIDARLHHTGGGIWVAEVRSPSIPGRTVWISDSEGREEGPFLIGAYGEEPYAEEAIASLSGACSEAELVERVSRALCTETEGS